MEDVERKPGGEREEPEAREDGVAQRVDSEARESLETLAEGRSVLGALPLRSVAAVAIFVAVFLVVYVAMWALLGGAGLVLGLLVAPVAAALAVHLYARARA